MDSRFKNFLGTIEHHPNDVRDEINAGIGRALFVDWWASNNEEKGGAGVDFEVIAPATPDHAENRARDLVMKIEHAEQVDINLIYAGVLLYEPHWHKKPVNPKDFGWYLGMQMLGHGVSWSDDHPDIDLDMPYTEYEYDGPEEPEGETDG